MANSPLSRRKAYVYSDFHKDLTLNPVGLDLARKLDEESIKESIKNLVLTNRGERKFQYDLGCDIRKLLFDNISPETIILAKDLIRETIEAYEPRCSLLGVDVLSSIDTNAINIIITFSVINKEEPVTLNVTLYRVR